RPVSYTTESQVKMTGRVCNYAAVFQLTVTLCALLTFSTYQLSNYYSTVPKLLTIGSSLLNLSNFDTPISSNNVSLINEVNGLMPLSGYLGRNNSSPDPTSCPRSDSQASNRLCVPLTLADLNSTCPKPVDFGRLRCGFWLAPPACGAATACVAVIVPYRNRLVNLLLLVQHLHNLLQRQAINHGIFVVEQNDQLPFNRAKLLNIGFKLSQNYHSCDCFVFHDADKLPESLLVDYSCSQGRPRHLIGRLLNLASRKYSPGKMYHNFFGGVVAVTKRQFESVNGNSNLYYGWGREDDELSVRLRIKHWRVAYSDQSAKYVNLKHADDIKVNSMPWPSVSAVRRRMTSDGLNSLKYNLTGVYCHPLFTIFSVQV
ncbi:hypothetical protein BOX15_Mlig000520g15, partial [Macrostomum lignano]